MAKIDELGVKGAAEHYGVHRATVHRWVGRKK
jgi:transposase